MANTKPGERKLQILQALAAMLERPRGDRITTAALAAQLDVSEAALYRHFASKAQMFEGLIEFIETSVFGLINKISDTEENGIRQVRSIAGMLLEFAEQNPGMTRVMIGDALVNEDERLQLRMNQFVDRIEMALRQAWKIAATQGDLPENEASARAALVMAFVMGRWHRYAKGGFQSRPTDGAAQQLAMLSL
jgi:TetR/AcrR family transcriptional regulator